MRPSVGERTRSSPGVGQPSLSVVEPWGASTILLLLLVVLHAFQSLTGKVLKHNVVVAGGRDKENEGYLQGRASRLSQRSQRARLPMGLGHWPPGLTAGGRAGLPGWHIWLAHPPVTVGLVTCGLQPVVGMPEEGLSLPFVPEGCKVTRFLSSLGVW